MTIKKINYQGWEDSYILSNSQIEAIVVPEIGRIMQFRFQGGENTFWEDSQLYGKIPNLKSEEWNNFGGDKTWPAPQSEWEEITKISWPPPTTFDSVPLKIQIQNNEITLISEIDPFYGIRFYRQITLEANQPIMKVTTTFEKVKGDSQQVSVWTIAQLNEPVCVYAAIPQNSIFPQGYNQQSDELPANLKVDNGILSLKRDRNKAHKIGSDASTLLWLGETVAVRMDSPRIDKVIYPDNNSSAEIYTNYDPKAYVELEFLSPLKTLQVGEKMDLTVTYTLFKTTSENVETQVLKILER
ncbi:DUF4380 domain-containing protein [Rivularia sp. UHCC 0363]|uniref:DUF4380 domain-containing protein n=1 Tax=Rivularia sp. UHCC 0363 TaxID=3110244 RepID=UPI002B1F3704|nr:DUF4380 domain-containing protein [Rivularia sp. UHCC 0363]MEA5594713.1 DUF4380 domain-containing protein [Rivularia sp. UHCC 0363]